LHILTLLAIIGYLALLWLNVEKPEPMHIYGIVSDFQFLERNGEVVNGSDLSGRIWIADFIFTGCAGPCPLMSQKMAYLQNAMKKYEGVVLASFSVDPENDSPEVLSEYADRYGAEKKKWLFLTGEKEPMYQFILNDFHLGVHHDIEEIAILHSTKFVLVDTKMQIRGYYDSLEPKILDVIVRDVVRLLDEERTQL